jgi:hypothetical protein
VNVSAPVVQQQNPFNPPASAHNRSTGPQPQLPAEPLMLDPYSHSQAGAGRTMSTSGSASAHAQVQGQGQGLRKTTSAFGSMSPINGDSPIVREHLDFNLRERKNCLELDAQERNEFLNMDVGKHFVSDYWSGHQLNLGDGFGYCKPGMKAAHDQDGSCCGASQSPTTTTGAPDAVDSVTELQVDRESVCQDGVSQCDRLERESRSQSEVVFPMLEQFGECNGALHVPVSVDVEFSHDGEQSSRRDVTPMLPAQSMHDMSRQDKVREQLSKAVWKLHHVEERADASREQLLSNAVWKLQHGEQRADASNCATCLNTAIPSGRSSVSNYSID